MRNCNAPLHYPSLSLSSYWLSRSICGLSVTLLDCLSESLFVSLTLSLSLSVGCVSICNVGINSMWMHVMFMSLVCCVSVCVKGGVCGWLYVCVWCGSTNGLIANCCRWKCQQEWHACKSSSSSRSSRRWRGKAEAGAGTKGEFYRKFDLGEWVYCMSHTVQSPSTTLLRPWRLCPLFLY